MEKDLNKDVSFLIKNRRIFLNEDPSRLAAFVKLPIEVYRSKEQGNAAFTLEEMLILMDRLGITLAEIAELI